MYSQITLLKQIEIISLWLCLHKSSFNLLRSCFFNFLSSRTILLEFKRTTPGQATCKSQNLPQEEDGEKEEKTMPFVSNHMEEMGVSSFREKKCKRLWLLLE